MQHRKFALVWFDMPPSPILCVILIISITSTYVKSPNVIIFALNNHITFKKIKRKEEKRNNILFYINP